MPKDSLKDKLDGNELDLSLSNLEVVPVKELAALPKGTHLDLSCNLLITLPDNFCTLTHLVKIDLSKNKLTELPQDFGRLDSLQHLDLLGNQLTTLPESFSNLRRLKWLDLKDNPLEAGLKKNAGDCLDEKQCRACAQRILLHMKDLSSQMERRRQARLKEERVKEAKLKAVRDEEERVLRDEKKAEKQRKKQEAQERKALNKGGDSSANHRQAQGDSVQAQTKPVRKDKTGRGLCTCCVMLTSIFAVLVALMVGVAFHCSANLKDRYCKAYVLPAQAQVLEAGGRTGRQAEELYRAASARASVLLEAGQEAAHSLFIAAKEMVEGGAKSEGGGSQGGAKSEGGGSQGAGKT